MESELIEILKLIGGFVGLFTVTYWLYRIDKSRDSLDIEQDTPYNESD